MPRYRIHHRTRYTYASPARANANRIILFPHLDDYQEIIKHDLKITGDPLVYVYQDYFGNTVGNFNLNEAHDELIIDSILNIKTRERPVPDDSTDADAQWKKLETIDDQRPYIDYIRQEYFNGYDQIAGLIDEIKCSGCTPYKLILKLSEWVYKSFKYIKGITSVESSLDEIWNMQAGVCQDFAHILLAMLRMVRIPARYVSGYICPDNNQLRGLGATHAWVEAYVPDFGWLGIDPTNNCLANDKHVRIAIGRNYDDCAPVKGIYKGSHDHHLDVFVAVQFEDGHISEAMSELDFSDPANVYQVRNTHQQQQ